MCESVSGLTALCTAYPSLSLVSRHLLIRSPPPPELDPRALIRTDGGQAAGRCGPPVLNHTAWACFPGHSQKVVCSSESHTNIFRDISLARRVRILAETITTVNYLVRRRETWTGGAAGCQLAAFILFSSLKNASKHTIIKQSWARVTPGPGESFSNSGIVCWIPRSAVVRRAECVAAF